MGICQIHIVTHSRDFFKMENGESSAKLTVFGKPNFGDPTLFEKKHEVLGYYVQKWQTGDYGAFQPEYAILPQAAAKLYDPEMLFVIIWSNTVRQKQPYLVQWDMR